MLKVINIRMEYLRNPIGIERVPWISWEIDSDRRCVTQTAYQILLSEDACFEQVLYDSGWVESQESAHIQLTISKEQLKSCCKYYVKARIRDCKEESNYSETCTFVTAILNLQEWKADFITAERIEDKDKSKSTCLRKEIRIQKEVKEAYVCTTSLGLYHFYINGGKVGEDELTPGWTSYEKHLCYQTYEVTSLLKVGKNALGGMIGAGWYKGKMGFLLLRNNYGQRTGFLMQMMVRYVDGSSELFLSDESWSGTDGPVTFSEIYDGEIYCESDEIEGWNQIGPVSSLWKRVDTIPFGKESLTAQAGSKVKKMETFSVSELITTPKGEVVLDFSQNMTGWIQFRVTGKKGAVVKIQCFETLDSDGNVYIENLRSAKQQLTYICKGDQEEEYHPHFTFQGFRYAQIVEWPSQVEKEKFTAWALYSEMEQTGEFTCSNPLVNQLQKNILWGLKGNFVDIPMDCPQRDERMGWTGDAQIFCRTACYLMNTYTFFSKWLKDVAADQTAEGGIPHVVPDIISGKEENDWLLSQGTHSAAAWADVAIINPWTLYLVYGDITILEEQYESMKKWIQFMKNHAEEYIWNYRLQFGDWVALDAEEGSYFGATPNELTCTAYFAYSTKLFSKINGILGKKEEQKEYLNLYDKIVEKFQAYFFDSTGYLTVQTQTAHIIALYFDLTPPEYKKQIADSLELLLEKENNHLVTGFVGTPYFCHALSQNNKVEKAYELLEKEDFPSWLYQVKKGATTVWEHWDGLKPDGTMWSPDMNSFNHYAYGAVGDWLYRVVLGMEIDEEDPGYHHSIIRPLTGHSFSYAGGTYHTLYGELGVKWEKHIGKEGEDIRILEVNIPHNTTSTICLEPGARVIHSEELTFEDVQGCLCAGCGSGCYQIEYSL